MRVSVKVLNGQEGSLAVSPSSQVSEVKKLVHTTMSIPISEQKLLYHGKALADDKLLKDYEIPDGARLTLVVKKNLQDAPSPISDGQTVSAPLPPVWEKLQTFLKRHFRERDAELVLAEFRKFPRTKQPESLTFIKLVYVLFSFELGLSQLSLDEIDRYAANKMRQLRQQ